MRILSARSLWILIALVGVAAVAAVVFFMLKPSKASASIIDMVFYNLCHDHVDNNGGHGIDLRDSFCASVENDAPEGYDQNLTTDEETAVTTTLTGSDPDTTPGHPKGDILYFTISMLPENGTLTCGDTDCSYLDAFVGSTAPGGKAPTVTYTPNTGFSGDDEFDFTASDGLLENANSDATIYIHVNKKAVVPPVEPADPIDPPCTGTQTLVDHVCVDNPPAETPTEETAQQTTTTTGGSDAGGAGRIDLVPAATTGGSTGGVVLGASTEVVACSNPLITAFLRKGFKNDEGQVKKLQEFLNFNIEAKLEVNGIFDAATEDAVKAFQLKYADEVLKPWKPWGLKDGQATGYVYKTTQRMINLLSCSTLDLPAPQLP